MDKNNEDQSHRRKSNHGGKPEGRKGFPNYLVQRPAKFEQEERKHPAAFNGKEARTITNHVPFLERKPEAYRENREPIDDDKHRSAQSKERISKREERIRTSLPLYSRHKSRRPFRPTELPSPWSKREEKQEREYDLPALKAALRIREEDLILIDLNPPAEADSLPKPAQGENRPNRALHRSLSGIMEQERINKGRKKESLRLKRNDPNGYTSYFK